MMNMKRFIPATLALLLVVWMPASAGAASADELEKQFLSKIDELLPGMGAEKLEDRQAPQIAFERICFDNSGPDRQVERAALCKAIMQRVGPDVAMPARVWLLRKVEPIGREEVVTRLAELMGGDSEALIRESARRALANNPAEQAGAALRAELNKATESDWRMALINALAVRRDGQAVPQITKLAKDSDLAVATAAITALGRIGDDASVQALAALRKSARPELQASVVDASFHAAEALIARGNKSAAAAIYEELNNESAPENVRMTALQGIAAAKGPEALPTLMKVITGSDERLQLVAARCAQQIPGESATQQLTAALEGSSPSVQTVVLEALGQRGDASALPTVVKHLDATEPEVRVAAIGALRYIGNETTVAKLATLAAHSTGPERDAARDSLKWMRGQAVDQTMLELLKTTFDRSGAELVRALAVRLNKAALPIMLKCINDPDETVRVPVIYNIGKLATPQDLNDVLRYFAKLSADQNEKEAKDALVRICSRIPDPDQRTQPLIAVLSRAEPMVQILVVQALGDLGGRPALDAVRSHLNSEIPQVKKAAEKAMTQFGPTYCTEWVFSGPYQQDGANHSALFDTAFPPEKAGAEAEWKPAKKSKAGSTMDLEKMARKEQCCGYLRTQIVSDQEQAVLLTFGSDDGIKVWLNGEVIHAKNASRGLNVDEDKVPAKLKKGENTLLVKVTQGSGQWAFACGIQAAQGGPAEGVKFEAK